MIEMARLECGKGRRIVESKLSVYWYSCQMAERL